MSTTAAAPATPLLALEQLAVSYGGIRAVKASTSTSTAASSCA